MVLLGVLGFGYGTIPALGPALDPGRGAWTSAAGGEPVRTQTLHLAGLQHAVTVSFTPYGLASVQAASDHDMFLALGYVHAQFRLTEMDEERRLGEGRLAQLGGPTDLSSEPTPGPTRGSAGGSAVGSLTWTLTAAAGHG